MTKPKLKRCPFCGRRATLLSVRDLWGVSCLKADCRGWSADWGPNRSLVIRRWNRRAK